MKIKFKEVYLHNFMSFKDASVDLDGYGFTSIKGQNNYIIDNADSNGSGKSAIWESVVWALTGSTIRGFSDVCRHDSEDGCYVRLKFVADKKEYDLLRSKNHTKYKTDLKIIIDGEDKSGKGIRDSEKLLAQFLPDLTSTLIGSVIVLGQGLPQRFSNNTPSGRKKVLEELSKSDFMIEDLKNRVSRRQSELNDKKHTSEKELIEATTKQAILKSSLNDLNTKLNSLNDISVSEELLTLTEQMRLKYEKESEEKTTHIEELKEAVQKLSDEIKLLNSNLIKGIDDANNLNKSEIREVSEEASELNTSIQVLKNRIKELDNIVDVCPTCGQKLPDVSKVDTTSMHKDLDEKLEMYSSLIDKKRELEKSSEEAKVAVRDKYSDLIRTLEENLKLKQIEISEHEKELISLGNKLRDCTENIFKYKNEIENFYTKKAELKSEIENAENILESVSTKVLYYNNILSDIEDRLGIMSNFSTVLSRDFRGILLSSIITFINDRAKTYAKYIFDSDLIEFILDGNNLNILYNNKEYESLSGGEKQKVDVIIQLSIRDMLCNHLDFSCNALVLDEITDNLDATGCEKMINLISSNLSDVENIYIISHRQDLNIPFDRELNVIKNEEGYSSIL